MLNCLEFAFFGLGGGATFATVQTTTQKRTEMKKVETIFARNSETDKKCKINRSGKRVPVGVIDQIEKGVTLEDVERLTSIGLPIKKYMTQITIHGTFPDVGSGYVFGYKSIIRNQNGSIGVRWIAVDEVKRQEMTPYLRAIGFSYQKDSTGASFEKRKRTSKETYDSDRAELLAIAEKIDTSLFIGSVNMYAADVWGMKYLILSLTVNGIYKENVRPFLDTMGATQEALDNVRRGKEQRDREIEEARAKRKEERELATKESEVRDAEAWRVLTDKHGDPIKHDIRSVGTFVNRVADGRGQLVYFVNRRYLKNSEKMPRYCIKEFGTVQECMDDLSRPFEPSIYDKKAKADSRYTMLNTFKGIKVF